MISTFFLLCYANAIFVSHYHPCFFFAICCVTHSNLCIILSSSIKKVIVDAPGVPHSNCYWPLPLKSPINICSSLDSQLGPYRLTVAHTRTHSLTHYPFYLPLIQLLMISNVSAAAAAPGQTSALLTNASGTRHWSQNWMIIQLMHLEEHEGDSWVLGKNTRNTFLRRCYSYDELHLSVRCSF